VPNKVVRALTCVPVLTLLVLLLVELWLRQGNPMDAIGIRNVDSWDIVSRINVSRKVCPQLALIGSSLMLVLNQDEHGSHFYTGDNPSYLGSLLRQVTGKEIKCINLSTGLQMVSEAYMVTEAACNNPCYPKVIIYGVSMRDFIQDALAAEWHTDSFNSVAPLVPVLARENVFSRQGADEFLASHFFYIYRNRTDFKNFFSVLAKNLIEIMPVDFYFPRLGPDHKWHQLKEGFLFEQWIPRKQEKFAEQMYHAHPEVLRDYYKTFQTMIYHKQYKQAPEVSNHYLLKLVQLCRRKGIVLVLVNMPLSPDTSKVVPATQMNGFRQFLSASEKAGNFYLIDLWGDAAFQDSDYKDGVHLNFSGAKKLADKIVNHLQVRYPAVLDVLKSGEQKDAL